MVGFLCSPFLPSMEGCQLPLGIHCAPSGVVHEGAKHLKQVVLGFHSVEATRVVYVVEVVAQRAAACTLALWKVAVVAVVPSSGQQVSSINIVRVTGIQGVRWWKAHHCDCWQGWSTSVHLMGSDVIDGPGVWFTCADTVQVSPLASNPFTSSPWFPLMGGFDQQTSQFTCCVPLPKPQDRNLWQPILTMHLMNLMIYPFWLGAAGQT
mmetsp:Transcript_119396/g.207862  ORF Transcript_119396/g.207862 Transcript_119396/m.207862 type:complete len:208 (+) Transcript_119396:984-1607(+)